MKQEFAQVNTPPPHAVIGRAMNIPIPLGFMQIQYSGLNRLDDSKKEIKRENVSKSVPTGIKRERE